MNDVQTAVVHIRFEGRSVDISVADLALDLNQGPGASDAEVKRAVAGYLDVTADKFKHYVIDRHETGNLTIRPEAVFG